MMRWDRARSIFGGSAVLAGTFSAAVYAQPDSAPALEEFVITGSRIVRQDYLAESPIVTLDRSSIDMSGPQLLDATLNTLPQFAPSNANASSSPARQGRNNANLRGLGIQRSLVLLDGRRMTPSDPMGAVDLNTITSSLIENIEVITGGASAVYGSDAIAGVMNVKLRRNFEGVEVNAQYGVSERGDGASYDLGVTMGGNFADGRGNMVGSITMYDRERVNRNERPFFVGSGIAGQLQGGRIVMSANNLPSMEAIEELFVNRYGSSLVPARNAPFAVYPDGTLFATQAPLANFDESRVPYIQDDTRVGFPIGETYPLQQPLERFTFFGRGRYELTDNVEAYIQFSRVQYDSEYSRFGWSASSVDGTPSLPVTNPFIPDDLAFLLASRANPDANFSFPHTTGRISDSLYQNSANVSDVMIGLSGNVGYKDWTWDFYASRGRTENTEVLSGFVDYESWKMLVNAPDGGRSVCPGGFNPFAIEMLSQQPEQEACYRLLNRTLQERTVLDQDVVEGVMQGAMFDLPAGEVRFAAGLSYREQSYDYRPPEEKIRSEVMPDQPTDVTGGSYDVYELFGEVNVPIVAGLTGVDHLGVGLAYRYSDYNLVGGINTYKTSLDWRVNDSFRVRASQQRAIRAPALGELYRPAERGSAGLGSTTLGGGDPCDTVGALRDPALNANHEQVRQLCLQQGVPESVIDLFRFSGSSVSGVAEGNTDLKEETSDTLTAGLVWSSNFSQPLLRNLQASIDYFDIQIDDAVGVVTASVGMQRCFNADGVSNPTYDPNNWFCQLTTRDENGSVDTQLQPTLNLASYKTSGVDMLVDWGFDLVDLGLNVEGSMNFNLVVSHLLSKEIQNLADEPYTDYAGTIGNAQIDAGSISSPDWRVNLNTGFNKGPYDVSLRYRWVDSMKHSAGAGGSTSQPGVTSRQYFDLLGAWHPLDSTTIRFGVTNLFDKEPPEWTGAGATDLAIYDLMQRRYFMGVTHRF